MDLNGTVVQSCQRENGTKIKTREEKRKNRQSSYCEQNVSTDLRRYCFFSFNSRMVLVQWTDKIVQKHIGDKQNYVTIFIMVIMI